MQVKGDCNLHSKWGGSELEKLGMIVMSHYGIELVLSFFFSNNSFILPLSIPHPIFSDKFKSVCKFISIYQTQTTTSLPPSPLPTTTTPAYSVAEEIFAIFYGLKSSNFLSQSLDPLFHVFLGSMTMLLVMLLNTYMQILIFFK